MTAAIAPVAAVILAVYAGLLAGVAAGVAFENSRPAQESRPYGGWPLVGAALGVLLGAFVATVAAT